LGLLYGGNTGDFDFLNGADDCTISSHERLPELNTQRLTELTAGTAVDTHAVHGTHILNWSVGPISFLSVIVEMYPTSVLIF
jgi:hypothetical protein